MAEYWKSTPRYWCKHCSTYVRDTKLERLNHEATGKHQGAVKRGLRDLHRGKENEERDRERARREVERLNGVVAGAGGASSSSSSRPHNHAAAAAAAPPPSEGERKRQAEQLALLGVSVPQEFRGDMAMAGEWTVTATKVVEGRREGEGPGAGARGVHKRERTEEELEEERAVRGLSKKPRRWGRDPRLVDGEDDLDALLNGELVVKKADEEDAEKKVLKEEEDADIPVEPEPEPASEPEEVRVKKEDGEEERPPIEKEDVVKTEVGGGTEEAPPVVAFKKRKPKNIRQK